MTPERYKELGAYYGVWSEIEVCRYKLGEGEALPPGVSLEELNKKLAAMNGPTDHNETEEYNGLSFARSYESMTPQQLAKVRQVEKDQENANKVVPVIVFVIAAILILIAIFVGVGSVNTRGQL